MTHALVRVLGGVGLSALGLYHLDNRFLDCVEGTDAFSHHTEAQHKKNRFSGMHQPYIPNKEQQELFMQHFPQFAPMLPRSLEEFQKQQALQTAVKIEPLKKCVLKEAPKSAGTVVVGGPPALLSTANTKGVTYINDARRFPIHNGSAFHLEFDAETEAPTTLRPHRFVLAQIYRAFFHYQSLGAAEQTGLFPWRSLDWKGWATHPGHWMAGLRIALAFQRLTRSFKDPETRQKSLQDVAARTKNNEKVYVQLNEEMGGKLISNAKGSIIVARTEEEKAELYAMKEGLAKEGREIRILCPEEMSERFGFVPTGVVIGEKTHDRVLNPNFMQLLAQRVNDLGGQTLSGTLTTIYTDGPEQPGYAQFTDPEGTKKIVPFSDLVVSLGNQPILGYDGKPLFDVVSARGVSVLAMVQMPKWRDLPQATICGGTNHVMRLSDPVEMKGANGQIYNCYLIRMTAGATITPNVSEINSANYDATIATGLIAAARKTLGCPLEVFSVYGCNRQMSEHGQTHWLTIPKNGPPFPIHPFFNPRGHDLDLGPYRPANHKGVVIQMGAGGGGLTQGPAMPPSDL